MEASSVLVLALLRVTFVLSLSFSSFSPSRACSLASYPPVPRENGPGESTNSSLRRKIQQDTCNSCRPCPSCTVSDAAEVQ